MFEQFPYTDMHQLNLDWIIKIAKDFLDQYTSLQQMISDGEQSLTDLTQDGLNDLQEKADTLQGLLDAWYTEHSEDIANQLTSALSDLSDALTAAVASFRTAADAKGAAVIASIPADYSSLAAQVSALQTNLNYLPYLAETKSYNLLIGSPGKSGYYFVNGAEGVNASYNYAIVPVTAGKAYKMRGVRYVASASETYMDNATVSTEYIFYPESSENVYVTFSANHSLNYPVYFGVIERMGINNPESYYHSSFDTDYIMTIISTLMDYKNLFRLNYMVTQYCKIDDTWQTGGSYTSYDTFVVNVTAGTTYKFGCDIRFLNKDDTLIGTNISEGYEYTADSNGTLYCSINRTLLRSKAKCVALPNTLESVNSAYYFTFNPNLVTNSLGSSKTILITQYAATKGIQDEIKSQIEDRIYSKGYGTASGPLTNGDSLTIRSTNVKKDNIYSVMTDLSSFNTLRIGHAKNSYGGSWIDITQTKVIVHNYFNSDSVVEFTHGLTISDYLYVQITVKVGKADINVFSNNSYYKITDADWTGYGNGLYFVESSNTVTTNTVFTWASAEFRKPLWIFGDSYVDITNTNRWANHIIKNGYGNNVLVNGYGGEDSGVARDTFRNCIAFYGKPKTLLWCMGMNDDADTDADTPDAGWLAALEDVIDICDEYGIELILATIPSVPGRNNEGKNTWIRSHDYKYVDMAEAVGAQANGTWYTGMLSNDNVHPTQIGAMAMYYAALTTVPEITYPNP